MKTSELIKIIKEALLPEIEAIVTKRVAAAAKKIIQENRKRTKPTANSSLTSIMQERPEPNPYEVQGKKKLPPKQYTKNKMLNNILNETADQAREWKNINSQEYTSDVAKSFKAANPSEAFGGKLTAQQMIPEDRQGRQIPDALAKALTKDYSSMVNSETFKKRGA